MYLEFINFSDEKKKIYYEKVILGLYTATYRFYSQKFTTSFKDKN